MHDGLTLFFEDFAALTLGVIGGDYSPAGEYHVVPSLAHGGRWRETVIHHSYARCSRGNWQVVPEIDGGRALEQTAAVEHWEPMLAAGEPLWRDVTVQCRLRPLTVAGWRAVIFRYRHARRFYAAAFHDDIVRIIRRDNDKDTVLGRAACALDPDRYVPVKITSQQPWIRLEVDGREVLQCEDRSAGAFASGGIALAATNLTRFRDVRVIAPADVAAAIDSELAGGRRALAALQASHPRPVLWRKISTPDWGTDRNLRWGDLDGDGRPEAVLAQRTDRLGGDNFCSISGLAAYDLDGRRLWTIGEAHPMRHHTTSDLCFQVHDWDGDGRAEVIFCRDWQLCIADGSTGRIRRTMPHPHRLDRDPAKPARIFADSLYFCDLTGSGRPDCILVKDRYKHLYAYDRDLWPLWQFSGNLGHYPYAADIDGDERDEVLIGHHLLDHDGKLLWSLDLHDHADNVALVDTGAGMRAIFAASDAGFHLRDIAGAPLAHYPIGHAQSMCIARLLPQRRGLQTMVNTYWGPAGITATLDEMGRLIAEFEPMPYACLLQPVNWSPIGTGGAPCDLVLLSTHPAQGGLIDGLGRRCVMFPDDGHPVLCCDARDLDGDGIDEVLTWDEREIWIYKADVAGRTPANYPARNPWFNDSNYRAQISLPRHA